MNYVREFELKAGVARDRLYDVTLYVLAGFLVIGLICNVLVRPLIDRWFMTDEAVAALQPASALAPTPVADRGGPGIGSGRFDATAVLAWAVVGIPLLWGLWIALVGAAKLFG